MNPVIELDQLRIEFGKRRILHDLQIALQGRCVGLLGPNGAGKTTLIHTLLGFHLASAGTARIGKCSAAVSDVRLPLGRQARATVRSARAAALIQVNAQADRWGALYAAWARDGSCLQTIGQRQRRRPAMRSWSWCARPRRSAFSWFSSGREASPGARCRVRSRPR